jgi:hypothetical protein
MTNIINFLINIVFISIPEEFFIAFLILFFIKIFRIKNHDYFDIHNNFVKKNIRLFLYSVLPMAILSNFLSNMNIDLILLTFIGIFATTLSIVFYLKNKSFLQNALIFVITFVVLGILYTEEGIISQIISSITYLDFAYYKNDIWSLVLISLFYRAIEYAFVGYIIFKKNSIIKVNVLKTIIKSKILLSVCCTYVILNVVALIVFCKCVVMGDILTGIDPTLKLMITLGVFILIIFDICSMWLTASLIQIKERYKYKYGKELKI